MSKNARQRLFGKKLKKDVIAEKIAKGEPITENTDTSANKAGTDSSGGNVVSCKPVKKKFEEDEDPLNFFNKEHIHVKAINPNDKAMDELLGIKVKDKEEIKKQFEEPNSEEEEKDEEERNRKEEIRLQNKQQAQLKLFSNNNFNNENKTEQKKKPEAEKLTKETVMEKFGDDFDAAVELPELNEQKKRILVEKMRKTINKMSSLRIQKHMDSELRQMIEAKIEELKKIKGANYNKIANTVEELILSLKQPDYYFADDEDVHQISDVQEPYNIEPRKDIDFAFLMKQTPAAKN